MMYLLIVEVADAPDLDTSAFLEKVVAEWNYYLRLEKRGKVLAGGKLAGRRGAAAIFEAKDHQDMDRMVAGLPLFPHFSRMEVVPLVAAADALADSARLLKVLRSASDA